MTPEARPLSPALSWLGALAAAVLATTPSAVRAQTPFVHEVVDATGDVGPYLSLALDAQGNPRISYYAITAADLRYASKLGSTWTVQVVDATGNVGEYTSIAVDAQGNPRISYYSVTSGDLKYASRSGAVWTLETVDATGDVGQYSSLALDAQGNPRISYYSVTTGDLKYASKSGAVWTLETVDVTGDVGQFTGLAVDAQGNPRISYYDVTNGDLKYAFKNAGIWNAETVDATNVVGAGTSLVLDSQGSAHISYLDGSNFDLKYGSKVGSVWVLETVDTPGLVGQSNSLALDAQRNPRISYWDATNFDLKFASKSAGAWTVQTVDAIGVVGDWTGVALDGQGNARIAYNDVTNGALKYTDSSVHVVTPSGGEIWPVGALRTLTWSGAGTVDVYLSADGGATYELLLSGIQGASAHNDLPLRVPHLPTRFARFEVRRAFPFSTARSDTLFQIQTSIALLGFTAIPPSETSPGVRLSWSTDPGPADLAGYRVERRQSDALWQEIVPLTRETTVEDPNGGAGSRYRLTAINGLGEELVLGEVQVTPSGALAAWPLPYRGGQLHVSFVTSALFGRRAPADVAIYDVSGRLVRTIAHGAYPDGVEKATWDGHDQRGVQVPNGVYFLRATTAGQSTGLKLVVVR